MNDSHSYTPCPHSTEELLSGIFRQSFSDGLLKGFSSVIEFLSGDILLLHSDSPTGEEVDFTHHYFIRRLSHRRLLLGFSDSSQDLHVITVYDFDVMRVYAFIYAHRVVTTARGTFTWKKREN
ncbi:MAG: hypothetical protein IIY15_01365 [Flavobacteriales bacterium]|nr:hypothetical protein [Flavobacteriales bacterium]